MKKLGIDLMDDAPIFRNRSGLPYSKDTLGDDFRAVREASIRRTNVSLPTCVAQARSRATLAALQKPTSGTRWPNGIATNKRLRKTYNPVNVASVRRFDEARVAGAKRLEQRPDESIRAPVLLTLFKNQGMLSD